jgi:hypothetical protein
MPDLGARLQLLIGPTVPLPVPYPVIDSLVSIEITNRDVERDGFQMTFALGKDSILDYGLLMSGLLDPPSRVIVIVIINALPQVVIDGVITSHQVVSTNKPGESKLTVTGEDISLQLDLEEKSVTYPNQPDSVIVTRLIGSYAQYGLVPMVTPTTDVPIQVDRIPSQQGTDLAYIQELAGKNGFVFYIEPTDIPGVNTAYWGLDNRLGIPQPALTMNMGPNTNVDSPINFGFNALGPADPQVTVIEPNSKQAIPIPVPSSLRPPLASKPAASLRKTIPRNTANLSSIQAGLRALSSATDSSDAVTGTGQLDSVRYGRVLQARRLVGVRGAGFTYDGTYYVKEVTHHIERGRYTQSFTLKREGLGSLLPMVVP